MSRGVSYLAAYRLAKAQTQQVAYKQALMEIKDLDARARAYAGVIESIDETILDYKKLTQKVKETQDPKVKNEILQAEIALSQINERNAGNRVAAYRYADERFDAPSRTDAQIANYSRERSTAYTSNVSTLMNKVKATHGSVFSGLTKEQQQDAGIKLYDAIITEGNASRRGGKGAYTALDDIAIRKEIATMIGQTDEDYISPFAHAQAKEDYIQGVLGEAVGSTTRLRNAINTAAQAGVVTPNDLDVVLTEVAVAAAQDGFDDSDDALLFSNLARLYGPTSAIEFTGEDGKRKKIKFDDATNEQKQIYFKENKIPSTMEELFLRASVTSDPRVIRARRAGDQLTEIKTEVAGLQARRTAAIAAQADALVESDKRKNPENLRERQAEIFGQTLTKGEQRRNMTPEQIRRITGLEEGATTVAQEVEEADATEAEDAMASMTPAQINSYRAMAAAVQAQQDKRKIELDELQEDVYSAMSEQIKFGNIQAQDVYAKAEQLGNQMGGLSDSRRDFAQTVASRIYLDMYNDLEASMPAKAQKVLDEEFPDTKKDRRKSNMKQLTDSPPDGPPIN
jgi:hypothetical protein